MKTQPWNSSEVIETVRDRIWLYLSPSSATSTVLDAASLLQMEPEELLALGRVYFLTSNEVGRMLAGVPDLLRRLPTVTDYEEEWSTERIRGAIKWPVTLAARHTGAPPNLFVTRPTTRAYQTPENELLTFMLNAIKRGGEQSGWSQSKSEAAGLQVAQRTSEATRWLQSRMLQTVEPRTPTPRSLARVRSGRHRRRFQATLDAFAVYMGLVEHLDAAAIRSVVETRGLVTREPSVLFELLCLFQILDLLKEGGWTVPRLKRVSGGLVTSASHLGQVLDVYYQHAPGALRVDSSYVATLKAHGFTSPADLRPDLVICLKGTGPLRWLMIECKMGAKRRTVQESAREALLDLLAYQRAFAQGLKESAPPVGLGVAWGSGLDPQPGQRTMLCTPDGLAEALALFLTPPPGAETVRLD